MSQIGFCIFSICEQGALRVYRRKIVFPLFIFHIHRSFPGKEHTISTVTLGAHSRTYRPHGDTFQYILRRSDSHEITRFIFGQDRTSNIYGIIHLSIAAHSADSISFTILFGNKFRRLFSQIRKNSLHNREQGL